MAKLKRRAWDRYSARQEAQRAAAASDMEGYVLDGGNALARRAVVAKASAIAVKHGRSAAALACVWYEQAARASGADVPKAVPVVSANPGRIGALVDRALPMLEAGDLEGFAGACGDAVANEVKRSASRTMLANARRDGAQFAWVPQGSETCAFCIAVASNGWRYAKRGTVDDHADHIHPNCMCEFAVRFDGETDVEGYDPKAYLDMYKDADGATSKDKINAMRRELYEQNKDKINAQHRERYAAMNGGE
ncbi:MAG: hypothetical protein IKP01_02165 [Bacteroidales bacterium]|nr:hypothetical protein [Bacteroidales bacterium]